MAKSPDDIYKEDKVPLFARKGYRRKHKRQEGEAQRSSEEPARRPSMHGQRERRPTAHDEEFILLQGADPSKRQGRRSRSRTKEKLIRQVSVVLGCIAAVYAIILISIVGTRMYASHKSRTASEQKVVEKQQQVEKEKQEHEVMRAGSQLDFLNKHIQELDQSRNILATVNAPGRGMSEKTKKEKLEQALQSTPHFMEVQLTMAEHCLAGKEYGRAVELLTQALAMDPENMETRHTLGKALIKNKDYLAAERVGQWMLKDQPYSLEAHTVLANAYLNMAKLELAIRHLHKIVEFDSRNVVAQNNLGVAYSRMKNYPQAIKIFENILLLDAVNAVSYYNLAFCYAQINQPAKAAEVIEKAAAHFGHAFVIGWLERPDFEPVRNSKEFKALATRIQEFAVADTTLQLNTLDRSTKPGTGAQQINIEP